jgi:hypothetical protein
MMRVKSGISRQEDENVNVTMIFRVYWSEQMSICTYELLAFSSEL